MLSGIKQIRMSKYVQRNLIIWVTTHANNTMLLLAATSFFPPLYIVSILTKTVVW